jgi:hypothetical protein
MRILTLRTLIFVGAIAFSGLIGIVAGPSSVAAVSRTQHPISPDQPGNFALRNLPILSRCLGIEQNSSKDAGIWNCTYANDQSWHLGQEEGTSGYYQVINAYGQCLGVAGGSDVEGAQVVGWTCEPTHPDQYWTFDLACETAGTFFVFNYHSGYVLGVAGGEKYNGAPVVQWRWQEECSNNQVWVYYFISNTPLAPPSRGLSGTRIVP